MSKYLFRLALFVLLLVAVACNDAPAAVTQPAANSGNTDSPADQAGATQPGPPPSPTPVPPTPTPEEPMAATVNGQPIYLATYEEALARYGQSESLLPPDDQATDDPASLRARVLDLLIERALIEQAAAENGIEVTPEMVAEQVEELRRVAQEAGGEGSFEAWLEANQWSQEAFEEALAYEMLTERVAAVVTADVPATVKQVHARYIQVDDAGLAQSLHQQIMDGGDFAELARQNSLDQTTGSQGGDLGYFPQGSLLVPEIEAAAFSLNPGETGEVITATTPDGSQTIYYLVQVVDVDPARPLSPDTRATLLQERFESWLQERWDQAEIVRLIDTGGS